VAHVYVIDDDEQLLRMVGLMLERGGHNVTLINDPNEGINQINAHRPDVLVLDVMMPGKSGHDLTREIRGTKELEDLPILIVTARSQDIDRKTALQSGADDYLSKPVTSQELIERVDKLLTKKPKKQQALVERVIISVYGFRGGTGKTSLAVNLAGALRRHSQQEICLVDFSLSGGQIAHHLRLQTHRSWDELPPANKLDWPTLKEHLTIHPSGLHLLAASQMPQPTDAISTEAVTAILTTLQENIMFTIVDLPPVFGAHIRATLPLAYMNLHVLAPDVVSVQTAVHANQLLAKEGISTKYRSHILNQILPEAALTTKAVERGLNHRIAFHVGFDANQPRSLVQGVPLTLTSSQTPLPATVNKMAEAIWQRVLAKNASA
jgi:DNA-binding response OmpR family regulator